MSNQGSSRKESPNVNQVLLQPFLLFLCKNYFFYGYQLVLTIIYPNAAPSRGTVACKTMCKTLFSEIYPIIIHELENHG